MCGGNNASVREKLCVKPVATNAHDNLVLLERVIAKVDSDPIETSFFGVGGEKHRLVTFDPETHVTALLRPKSRDRAVSAQPQRSRQGEG